MSNKIHSHEITPEDVYLSRRRFFKQAFIASALSLVAKGCRSWGPGNNQKPPQPTIMKPHIMGETDELGNTLTNYEDIISYTNYYEFSTDKSAPTRLARDFKTDPWSIDIEGLVSNPLTLDLDDLRKQFEFQERIYRMRCVEGWSMVIPWVGFPLNKILSLVEPLSTAKYVRFETIYDPDQMPGQSSPLFPWPYIEGLRMDEAMHDLTLISTGIYGKNLTPQNGAPVRLVVPWKYGFKSIKSIVKISLVEEMPNSLWMAVSPNEYGFYANVNPEVSHPRWSQATERRISQSGRIETMMFNGYADEVVDLYSGMDLSVFF